jgi:microcystin degradation protein MlrC
MATTTAPTRGLRAYLAGFGARTNTFSTQPLSIKSVELGDARAHGFGCRFLRSALARAAQDRAIVAGWTLARGPVLAGPPSGPPSAPVAQQLHERALSSLKAALPLDIVFLVVPGSLVDADGVDCVGRLLAAVRAETGPNTTIGVLASGECAITEAIRDSADVVICADDDPVHAGAAADQLVAICEHSVVGDLMPITSVYDCRALIPGEPPLRPLHIDEHLAKVQAQPGVLAASVSWGGQWTDMQGNGTRVLVVTDDDPALSERCAREIGHYLDGARGRVSGTFIPPYEAPRIISADGFGPILLADAGDNPGDGAPGDATGLLQELIGR